MKTITTTVFEYDELTPKAKEKAREWFLRLNGEYQWAEEALESIKALAGHFGGKVTDYSIDWDCAGRSSVDFDMPDTERDEIASRLADLGAYNPETLKGTGECKLTGYCADEDAIDGFRKEFMGGENDLSKLMKAACESWLSAACADYEWQSSEEQVAENIRANEYTFTADGKRF